MLACCHRSGGQAGVCSGAGVWCGCPVYVGNGPNLEGLTVWTDSADNGQQIGERRRDAVVSWRLSDLSPLRAQREGGPDKWSESFSEGFEPCDVEGATSTSVGVTTQGLRKVVMYDPIIRHPKVVDGTGNPGFTGDVAVAGTLTAAVGRVRGGAARVIDACGLCVCPGSIDAHGDFTPFDKTILRTKFRRPVR
jgi:hypothetical protein